MFSHILLHMSRKNFLRNVFFYILNLKIKFEVLYYLFKGFIIFVSPFVVLGGRFYLPSFFIQKKKHEKSNFRDKFLIFAFFSLFFN